MRFTFLFFGFLLAIITIYALRFHIAPQIYYWHKAKSWTEVPAKLLSHNLAVIENETKDDEGRISISKTYRLTANYTYTIGTKKFTGNRVSFSDVADGNKSYYQSLDVRLNHAANNGGELSIWVDPKEPQHAVIDRDFRTYNFTLLLIVCMIFGGISFPGVYLQFRTWYFYMFDKKLHNFKEDALALRFATHTLRDQGNHQSIVMSYAIAAVLFGFIAIGMQVAVMAILKGEYLYIIGPIIGLAFISIPMYVVYKIYSRALHLGAMPLTIDKYPVAIGRKLSGNVLFKKSLKIEPSYMTIAVVCCRSVYQESGEINEEKLWVDSKDITWIKEEKCYRLNFDFKIPPNLPEPMNDHQQRVSWWINVTIGVPKKDEFSKTYTDFAIFKV